MSNETIEDLELQIVDVDGDGTINATWCFNTSTCIQGAEWILMGQGSWKFLMASFLIMGLIPIGIW